MLRSHGLQQLDIKLAPRFSRKVLNHGSHFSKYAIVAVLSVKMNKWLPGTFFINSQAKIQLTSLY